MWNCPPFKDQGYELSHWIVYRLWTSLLYFNLLQLIYDIHIFACCTQLLLLLFTLIRTSFPGLHQISQMLVPIWETNHFQNGHADGWLTKGSLNLVSRISTRGTALQCPLQLKLLECGCYRDKTLIWWSPKLHLPIVWMAGDPCCWLWSKFNLLEYRKTKMILEWPCWNIW